MPGYDLCQLSLPASELCVIFSCRKTLKKQNGGSYMMQMAAVVGANIE